MTELPVTFRSQGQQVVGMLHRPRGRGRHPAVVFLHGFTATSTESHRLFVEAARHLAGLGFASLRFDFRGSGNSAGSFAGVTISSEVADARAALRWLRRQPGIDSARTAVVGMSLGGLVAAHVLAGDRLLQAGVLWNPVAFPKERRDTWMTLDHLRQLKKRGVIDWGGWPIGRGLYRELGTCKPIARLVQATCPVRIIQSGDDQTTPPAGAQAYADAMRKAGRPCDLQLVEGADHTFRARHWTESALQLTAAWLVQHLIPTPSLRGAG